MARSRQFHALIAGIIVILLIAWLIIAQVGEFALW